MKLTQTNQNLLIVTFILTFSLLGLLLPAEPAHAACGGNTNVGTEAALNTAIADYNSQAAPCDYTITLTADITLTANTTTINNANATTLQINGDDYAIDGNNSYRPLRINDSNVTVSNLTLKRGRADQCDIFVECGGAVEVKSGAVVTLTQVSILDSHADVVGGGVFNQGTMTILDSTFSGNNSESTGGGIYNASEMIVQNSTLNGNTARRGGGLHTDGNMTIVNSTIYNNSALSNGGFSRGGGIHNQGPLAIINSTISGNSAEDTGSGIYQEEDGFFNASLTISNSIVADQTTGDDCGGNPITSGGHNLESGTSCGFTSSGDIQSGYANLGSLQNNGGPTETLAPIYDSDAIDAADNTICAASLVNGVDQRGIARPQGTTCDIGAYEFEVGSLTVIKKVIGGPLSAGDFDIGVDGSYSQQVIKGNENGAVVFVEPGFYNVYELLTPDDYTISYSADCNGTIAANEEKTCTVTNTYKTTLKLVKLADPADGTNFEFTINIDRDGDNDTSLTPTLQGTQQFNEITYELEPGPVTITEAVPGGWQLDSAACTGGSDTGSLDGTTLSVNLAEGDTLVCTFTNSLEPERGNLTIRKEATPEDGTDFRFTTNIPSTLYSNINTVIGTGTDGFSGDGGLATAANLSFPGGIVFDDNGNIIFVDRGNHRIRQVDVNTGNIETVVGSGATGSSNGSFSGDGGLATSATLDSPADVTIDSAGNLYIVDSSNQRIRKVDANSGIITTIAGTGTAGFSGDGGPATSATMRNPGGIAVDSGGNVYFADTTNSRIRKIDVNTGVISTIAGNGIDTFSGDGGPAINASLHFPEDVAIDQHDQLYLADRVNRRIRKVDLNTGIITTVAGTDGEPNEISGDGGPAINALIDYPHGVAVDAAGNIYIADQFGFTIRKVDSSTGFISTIAGQANVEGFSGDGGPASSALFDLPGFVAVDSAGNVYVSDESNHRIRKIDALANTAKFILDDATPDDLDNIVQSITFKDIAPGTYQITESLITDWRLDQANCTGASGSVSLVNESLSVAVGAGENVTCTFTNKVKVGSLTIIKEATPEDGTDVNFVLTPSQLKSQSLFFNYWGLQGDTEAEFEGPLDVAVDSAGNVYVTDSSNHRIQKFDGDGNFIEAWGWEIDSGANQFEICTSDCRRGEDGAGIGQFAAPIGITVDNTNIVYVTEIENHRVQKFQSDGTPLDQWGSEGTDEGQFNFPFGIVTDSDGNIYVSELGNNRIQKFDSSGTFIEMWGWGVDTGANQFEICTSDCQAGIEGSEPGQFANVAGIAVDRLDNIYVVEGNNARVQKFDRNGNLLIGWGWGVRTGANALQVCLPFNCIQGVEGSGAGQFRAPFGIVVDDQDIVYITDSNNRVQLFETNGTFIEMWGWGVATGAPLFEICTDSCQSGMTGFGQGQFDGPVGITTGLNNDFYIADSDNNRIQHIDPAIEFTLDDEASQPNDSVAQSITFNDLVVGTYEINELVPGNWQLDNVSCEGNSLSEAIDGNAVALTLDDQETVVCTFTNSKLGSLTIKKEATPEDGTDFFFSHNSENIITTFAGDGTEDFGGDGGQATAAQFDFPAGIAFDHNGNLFIADLVNARVRKVDVTTGLISTVAGNGSEGNNGDGGLATDAQLNSPYAVAFDSAGNMFISDFSNQTIRKVDVATGIITTVAGNGTLGFSGDGSPATAAQLSNPRGIAFDQADNLYIADFENNRIRKVEAGTGIISTIAGINIDGFSGDGGPATAAQLASPTDVAIDPDGHLLIADSSNSRIRQVNLSTGIITTVVGDGTYGSGGDGGPATSAQLGQPYGIAFDAAGNLFIADQNHHNVRKVDRLTKIISTVAGTGTQGFGGDGGLATNAQLNDPTDVAIDPTGNLFIVDSRNQRIRKVEAVSHFALDDANPDDNDGINQTATMYGLTSGTYDITEIIPEGWQLDSVVCNTAAENYTATDNGVTVSLPAGKDVICTFTNAKQLPKASFGSCYDTFDETFNLTVVNRGGPGYIGYDVYTESSIQDLGFFEAGERRVIKGIALLNGNNDTLRKFVRLSSDDSWQQKGGTQVFDPINANRCKGSITVVKQAEPADGTDFPFESNILTALDISGESFTLDVDDDPVYSNTITFEEIYPGIYTVTELIPSGWGLEALSCETNEPDAPMLTYDNHAVIDLAYSEHVTCTFVNEPTEPAKITIIKTTNPSDMDEQFSFTGDLGDFSLRADGSQEFEVPGGSYTVTEINIPAFWTLLTVQCGDQFLPISDSLDPLGRQVTIEVEAGEDLICTFHNERVNVEAPVEVENGNTLYLPIVVK